MTHVPDDPNDARRRPADPAGRFVVVASLGSRQEVRSDAGVEVGTGRPVRIHRFRGAPRGAPSRLAHPGVPEVLAVERHDDVTWLVTVLPDAHVPLDEGEGIDARGAREVADALVAAHAAGSVHGDLGPHRLWRGPDGRWVVEGLGVPWRRPGEPPPGPVDDVRALARTLLHHGRGLDDDAVRTLQLAASRSAAAPADASALARRLAERGAGAVARSPDEAGTVVKHLPPGGVYRVGEESGGRRPPAFAPEAAAPRAPVRPPWTLLGLLAASIAVAGASLLLRERQAPVAEPPVAPDGFVVNVEVEPPAAPPLDIVVAEAPASSSLRPGTRLGRAPRRVVLDVRGRWVLHGEFAGRRTAPVVVTVPATRAPVLVFPPSGPPPERPSARPVGAAPP